MLVVPLSIYCGVGNLEGAIADFDKAIEINPKKSDISERPTGARRDIENVQYT